MQTARTSPMKLAERLEQVGWVMSRLRVLIAEMWERVRDWRWDIMLCCSGGKGSSVGVNVSTRLVEGMDRR